MALRPPHVHQKYTPGPDGAQYLFKAHFVTALAYAGDNDGVPGQLMAAAKMMIPLTTRHVDNPLSQQLRDEILKDLQSTQSPGKP